MSRITLYFFVLLVGFSSCVPQKKYMQVVDAKTQLETFYLDSVATLHQNISVYEDTVTALRLDLAERKGENNILVSLRNELQYQINELELEIELKSNQSASSQTSTKQRLTDKDNEISALQSKLASVNTAIKKYQNRLSAFVGDLSLAFQGYNNNILDISTQNDKAILVLSANNLLFKRATSTSMNDRGVGIVQQVSDIIKRYPDLEILVVGHTDNRQPVKSYKDNWYFSTLRAVTIVREMTQKNDVNNNQVSAVGKAEFAPIASNETAEGRAQNHRIEIIASPINRSMIRDIQQITKN